MTRSRSSTDPPCAHMIQTPVDVSSSPSSDQDRNQPIPSRSLDSGSCAPPDGRLRCLRRGLRPVGPRPAGRRSHDRHAQRARRGPARRRHGPAARGRRCARGRRRSRSAATRSCSSTRRVRVAKQAVAAGRCSIRWRCSWARTRSAATSMRCPDRRPWSPSEPRADGAADRRLDRVRRWLRPITVIASARSSSTATTSTGSRRPGMARSRSAIRSAGAARGHSPKARPASPSRGSGHHLTVRPGATIGAMPARVADRRRARSPASASSISRPCSPGRTRRCSWPTSGPTSSRSSRPRATRRAAGARRGSATRRPGRGPPPTTWRSTATSARSGSTCASRPAPRSCAGCSTDADVLVENLRPGSLARLGFDDEALRDLNPDLVHLAISGYGPDGPAADRPGYDFVIQAVGGLMSITGDADADGGHPTKVGVAISDVVAGLFATIGILAGLLARPPDGPVRGQRDRRVAAGVDAGRARQPGAERVRRPGTAPGRRGNAHPNIVPYETLRDERRRDRRGRRFRAAVAAVLRRDRGAGRWPTTRASRRTATAWHRARELAAADRRASRGALHGRLARGPDRRRRPVRPDHRRPHGVRVARGDAPDPMLVEVEHPAFGVLRQAGIPIEFERHAGRRPHGPAAARRAHRRGPRRSSASPATRSSACARPGSSRSMQACTRTQAVGARRPLLDSAGSSALRSR